MAATVELIDPSRIVPNPDNPRMIFRAAELEELEGSISSQGILVPLTLYKDGNKYVLLDGERRWRCAKKLGLHKVPAIVQTKPARVQNIMMMFAIHNARRDWDPLPTAIKLEELEQQLAHARKRKLTEAELAAAASLSRGAVRRYRKILRIPEDVKKRLLEDLEDPSSESSVSVDQVIEAVDASENLVTAKLISEIEKRQIFDAIVKKFENRIIKNTVDPRKISNIARAAKKGDIPRSRARAAVLKFATDDAMAIDNLVASTIGSVEQARAVDRGLRVFEEKWLSYVEVKPELVEEFRSRIEVLISRLRALL